jgi:hypothetical protein
MSFLVLLLEGETVEDLLATLAYLLTFRLTAKVAESPQTQSEA